ncbi:hypothetical protein FACS1894113_2430 [Alphaproteobacteria bacterium]|nr:hypothetical protein FACS1894113_2430 [Alphaproteobacteria bacterium]
MINFKKICLIALCGGCVVGPQFQAVNAETGVVDWDCKSLEFVKHWSTQEVKLDEITEPKDCEHG